MIFTLYSYKGGVGRSMALANVAHWFYLRGLSVVMVDWDLEAPGLETFFYKSSDKIELVRSHLGVIDLLTAYSRQFPYLSGPASWDGLPPIESYLCEIEPEVVYQRPIAEPSGRGKLRLLGAGWRAGTRFADYAEAVHAFDWAGFYTRLRGEEYFNWMRNQLTSLADVVLVDSRTGITEMGGVCTRHLADVVVTLCAPNSQNLQGALEMADSFQGDELAQARGRRLEVLILPARIDDQDSAGYIDFRGQFVSAVERFTPAVLRKWKRGPWDLAIPYKAQYSYGESLVTGVEGGNEQMELAYKQLATHIALFAPQGSSLYNACLPEMKPLAAIAGIDLSITAWNEAEAVVAKFKTRDLAEARRLLLRLVQLSPQSASLDSRRRSTRAELAEMSSADMVVDLITTGVIAQAEEADTQLGESLELAHESMVTSWPRLREWIEAQRPLLLWRQDLAAQAAKWKVRDHDTALLLRGGPLREALAKSPGADLTAAEARFVESSREFEEERERIEREQAEQARREERNARVRQLRLRVVLVTVPLILVLLLVGWGLYVRSDGYQASYVVARGLKVNVTASADYDPTLDWRNALLASGHVAEALAGVRQLPPKRDKFLTLANAAGFLWRAGLKPDAESVASEALNFNADSLKSDDPKASQNNVTGATGPTGADPRKIGDPNASKSANSSKSASDYQMTLVAVWIRLADRGLSPPKDQVEKLISSFNSDNPEEGVYVLGPLLVLVDSPELRKKYYGFATAVNDNRRRCDALLNLLGAARQFDKSLVPSLTEEATRAAVAIPESGDRAYALLSIASTEPSSTTWANAMTAIQSPPVSRDKLESLLDVARGLAGNHLLAQAADLLAKARDAANSLVVKERVSVLIEIARVSPDTAMEAQVLNEAARIATEPRQTLNVALEYGRIGRMGDALALAKRSFDDEEVQPLAQALVEIAAAAWSSHREADARTAAHAVVELYNKLPPQQWDGVTQVIPILYPDESAARLARAASTPEAYIALAQAARLSGNAKSARSALDEALTAAGRLFGAAKSSALLAVAQEYAVEGQLYSARKLADQCDPNDRLAAYAAILNAHTIQARPQLRDVIGGIFQTRK